MGILMAIPRLIGRLIYSLIRKLVVLTMISAATGAALVLLDMLLLRDRDRRTDDQPTGGAGGRGL
jgi:hypothetical protein